MNNGLGFPTNNTNIGVVPQANSRNIDELHGRIVSNKNDARDISQKLADLVSEYAGGTNELTAGPPDPPVNSKIDQIYFDAYQTMQYQEKSFECLAQLWRVFMEGIEKNRQEKSEEMSMAMSGKETGIMRH